MSFDLYFVPRPGPGRGWEHAMDEVEAAAAEQAAPSPEDRELWDRIVAAVAPIVPEGEVFEHERSRTFDDGVGLQLSMCPGEISINTPYWFEGEQAEKVVDRLKAVAAAVEEATGACRVSSARRVVAHATPVRWPRAAISARVGCWVRLGGAGPGVD